MGRKWVAVMMGNFKFLNQFSNYKGITLNVSLSHKSVLCMFFICCIFP